MFYVSAHFFNGCLDRRWLESCWLLQCYVSRRPRKAPLHTHRELEGKSHGKIVLAAWTS